MNPVHGLLAVLLLIPVTLPVPVLRELVQERFGVGDFLTSLFMSINMVGALFAAPAVALADRIGHRRTLALGALALDAVCFFAMTLPVSFPTFLAIRFLEGGAHIAALSLLLAIAAGSAPPEQRGRAMGMVGGGLLLGVALGAMIGGQIGQADPLRPLEAGAGILALTLLLAAVTLRDAEGERRARAGPREIARLLRANRLVVIPLLFAFADRFTVGFFTTTFSLYLRNIHDVAAPSIGILIALFMLPFALLSVPLGWASERLSPTLLLCGGSLVYGVGTASITYWSPAELRIVMVALGATAAAMFVPSLVLTSQLLPDRMRTTAMGAFTAAGSLGFIVGPLVGGLVSEGVGASAGFAAGYRAAFWIAGGSEVLLALATWPILRRALGNRDRR